MEKIEDSAKSTRERVLQSLLIHNKCTINELADEVEINPISVRHHITKLEAEGLVVSIEERHGVGRPRRLYFLSEKGREQFPRRYLRLVLRLLDQLKHTMPEDMVDQLFADMAKDLAEEHKDNLSNLNIEQKLDLITTLLTEEGFTVNWELKDNAYYINESNCPYIHVGQNHPEICSIDRTLIATILDLPTKKIHCKLKGDTHCTYIVPKPQIMETARL
ncbi:MAG: helix-turn-helix transcriptional regulator [Anaerolineales bacterium]